MTDPARQNGTLDVVIVGGGPAGSILACLLAQAGYSVMVIERDIHPREHVGESLTPSTNFVFKQIGVLERMEEIGFVHKRGACWTAPRARVGSHVSIRLDEFPPPDAVQLYTYNVERDDFDAMLLRNAHEQGAKVLQGVKVEQVLFEGDRAVGVRARVADGWERDVFARVVVDASGRRCVVPAQLKLKSLDPQFSQRCMYSWFTGVEPHPPGTEGMLFLHFVAMERAWVWEIPLRNGIWSVGVVTDKADFKKPGTSEEEFFSSIVERNANLRHYQGNAERIRPYWVESDYSYEIEQLVGNGWLLVGDAVRFVDPIFSTGVDVASYSALYAFEAIKASFEGDDEERLFRAYERRISDGVEAWYDLIALFYKLQNLFTYFALRPQWREHVVRILQGNLYIPDSLARAREMIGVMEEAYERAMANPSHLLRPWALTPRSGAAAS